MDREDIRSSGLVQVSDGLYAKVLLSVQVDAKVLLSVQVDW
jgi:hypothetical protein